MMKLDHIIEKIELKRKMRNNVIMTRITFLLYVFMVTFLITQLLFVNDMPRLKFVNEYKDDNTTDNYITYGRYDSKYNVITARVDKRYASLGNTLLNE
jgi:hypothetical protein